MNKATEPEEVNLHEVNLDALSEIKKIALNIPLNEKLYALSLYQPCGGNDENIIDGICCCKGYETLRDDSLANIPPSNIPDEPCYACGHNIEEHTRELSKLNIEQINAKIRMLVDSENVLRCTYNEGDRITRDSYLLSYKKLLSCVEDISTPEINDILSKPPYGDVSIKQAIANFVSQRPLKRRETDTILAIAFIQFFNNCHLDHVDQHRKLFVTKERYVPDNQYMIKYHLNYVRFLWYCHIPAFHASFTYAEPTEVFGYELMAQVRIGLPESLLCHFSNEADEHPDDKNKRFIADHMPAFFDSFDVETLDPYSNIWEESKNSTLNIFTDTEEVTTLDIRPLPDKRPSTISSKAASTSSSSIASISVLATIPALAPPSKPPAPHDGHLSPPTKTPTVHKGYAVISTTSLSLKSTSSRDESLVSKSESPDVADFSSANTTSNGDIPYHLMSRLIPQIPAVKEDVYIDYVNEGIDSSLISKLSVTRNLMLKGEIKFQLIGNSTGKVMNEEDILKLLALQTIIMYQLPNMPKVHITRTVFDRRHESLVLLKDNRIIGGIVFRFFETSRFSEIVFLAVISAHQDKGYGAVLMNMLKDLHVKYKVFDLLTFADRHATGYFKKLGFSSQIALPKKSYEDFMKSYDDADLMGCRLFNSISYICHDIVKERRYEIINKAHELMNNDGNKVFEGLSCFDGYVTIIPASMIPGVSEIGYTQNDVDCFSSNKDVKRSLGRILQKMKTFEYAWPFLSPVDINEAPDYFDYVKHPIDLETMSKKLGGSVAGYDCHLFAADMRRMIDNCKKYNQPHTRYWTCADRMESYFKARMREERLL